MPIFITCDIDWASEEVLADTFAIFEQYNVKCTLFATHDSEVVKNCNKNIFEVAIHPNFNPLLEGKSTVSANEVIDKLLEIYPTAKGVRSHGLVQSSRLLSLYKQKSILYECDHFCPYQKIEPYALWNGLLRIPYNWEDDIHYLHEKDFGALGVNLLSDDLLIFDFHPIHIFLNTDCEATYLQAKPYYHDYKHLKEYRNTQKKGVRDALITILEYLKENQTRTTTLSEFYYQFSTKA